MMDPCIFVASHIHYNGQVELLHRCLTSLVNQTKKVKIYVSLSFENKFKQDLTNQILMVFSKDVQFVFHKKQLFQMEHIYELTRRYAEQHEFIMFCDDDDTYKPMRVEMFCQFYEFGCENKVYLGGVKEIVDSDDPGEEIPEFWNYGIKPIFLIEFFNRFIKNNRFALLQHIFGDMYLRYYLRSTGENKDLKFVGVLIDKKENGLYQHHNNDNSICGTLGDRDPDEIYFNNVLLEVMNCHSNDMFRGVVQKFNLSGESLSAMRKLYSFLQSELYV